MASKRITVPVSLLTAAAIGVGGFAAAGGASASNAAPSHNASAAMKAAPVAHAARATTLRLTADPHGALRFNTKRLTARAGKVQIVLTNPSSSGMPHGIAIRGHGSGRVVGPGGTSTVTATLKRGTYTFLCPVPGHAQGGMTGTLTVR
jgi:plastocyanin